MSQIILFKKEEHTGTATDTNSKSKSLRFSLHGDILTVSDPCGTDYADVVGPVQCNSETTYVFGS
jgi:hypothetical protein